MGDVQQDVGEYLFGELEQQRLGPRATGRIRFDIRAVHACCCAASRGDQRHHSDPTTTRVESRRRTLPCCVVPRGSSLFSTAMPFEPRRRSQARRAAGWKVDGKEPRNSSDDPGSAEFYLRAMESTLSGWYQISRRRCPFRLPFRYVVQSHFQVALALRFGIFRLSGRKTTDIFISDDSPHMSSYCYMLPPCLKRARSSCAPTPRPRRHLRSRV